MNNYSNQRFNANDFGAGLGGDNQEGQDEQNGFGYPGQQQYPQQNQGYNPNMMNPNMMNGQQMQMDPNMMMQQNQQQQQQFNQGGMYTNQFMPPQGNFGPGPQMSMPGQFQGFDQQEAPQQMQAAPVQAPSESKEEEGKANSFAAAGFDMKSLKTAEFVPKGAVALTQEQFPDLLGALDADAPPQKKGKKGKKGKGAVAAVAKQEVLEEIDETTPWKGKKSEFFVMGEAKSAPENEDPQNPMNLELNDSQWDFVFKYYPEYAASPFAMISWIYTQVIEHENQYAPPTKLGGRMAGEEDSDEAPERVSRKYDGINQGPVGKQKSKAKQKQLDEEAAKKQKEDKAAHDKKIGKVAKSEAQVMEEKMKKAHKDVVVNMNPDDAIEVDTTREPISMVFIGHVDAGKSTICGNLMYMMDVVDARIIEKYKQEAKDKGRDSWWLAYCMDVSDEEKNKGKTVEVGRAQFDTKTKKYTIFDAPGHKNYVPNMIMGAALADVGGLVISARKGEFEAGFEKEGQTREHAQLAKSLGVQKLVIIINKMDDCRWSQERFDEIKTKLKPFLNATGYPDSDLIWVPIAGLTGQNIKDPLDGPGASWYKGKPLLTLLDEIPVDEGRDPEGPLRIPILDKMKDKDLVIHGKVESGTIRLGDKLAIMPSGNLAQVLGLLDGKGAVVKYAAPGENVQIKINVADDDLIQRGFVLCKREFRMPVTDIFEAEVDILDLLDYKPIISKGYTCIMHIHTFNDEVVIKDIISVTETDDKGETKTKQKPQFARSQTKIICRMHLKNNNPIALEKFDVIPQCGRFTLRDEGKTICVGKVLKYKPYKSTLTDAPLGGAKSVGAQKSSGAAVTINNVQETVFDMETGESRPAAAKLGGIAEGDEEDDE